MKFRLEVTGTSPLIMHNARLSDPLDPMARELKRLNGKRTKTEDDHRAIARQEFLGGLYYDADLGPYVPAQNFEACLVAGAKRLRLGSTVKTAVIVETDINPVGYTGPRDPEALFVDANFVNRASAKVGTARVMRTRPQFREWTAYCDGDLDTNQLDPDQFQRIIEIAGSLIGIADWRPRHGRFVGTVTELRG